MADKGSPVAPAITALIIMGVSGSGKTTLGALLAGQLGWAFADADDFHPAANVAKMRAGHPLDDADRAPWLVALASHIDAWRQAGQHGVLACSALKRRYRDALIAGHADVRLVFLTGDPDIIAGRMAARHDHYMPAALLASQLDTLEPPDVDEHPIIVSIRLTREEQVARVTAALR